MSWICSLWGCCFGSKKLRLFVEEMASRVVFLVQVRKSMKRRPASDKDPVQPPETATARKSREKVRLRGNFLRI